ELGAAAADPVGGIARVQATQLGGYGGEIGLDLVHREAAPEVVPDVLGQGAVATTEQERRPHPGAPVAVDGDDVVHVVEEASQRLRRRGVYLARRDVPLQVRRMVDAVVRR